MILLAFAHRPEARAFLHHFKELKSVDEQPNLYISSELELALLITGEGHFSAAIELTQALSRHKSINYIINLGVAGALSPDQEVGDILQARTSYMAKDGQLKKMEFKSFELKKIKSDINCVDVITSQERVLNQNEKSFFANFGELIDRELWGLCHIAHKFNLPISSFKIISDDLEQENFCEVVKLKADKFSLDLLNFCIQEILSKVEAPKNKKPEGLSNYLYSIPGLFFSTAQKNLVKKYEKKINLTEELIKEIDNIVHNHTKSRPKDVSRSVLELFEKKISPETYALSKTAKKEILIHNNSSIKFYIDPIYESCDINFSGVIKCEKDKNVVMEKINKLPLDRWNSVLNGDESV